MTEAQVLVALLMAVGLAGTLIPIVPGLLLVWGAAVVYGLIEGFSTGGWVAIVIITVLFVISVALGLAIPQRKAVESGATVWGQAGAVLGAIVGFFVIPVVGALLGAPLGAFAFEWFHQGDWTAAKRATRGLMVGMGWSTLVNLMLGVVMVATWGVWAFA